MKVNPERVVIGKRAVTELLRRSPERLECLISSNNKLEGEIAELVQRARIKIKNVRSEELTEVSLTDSHQGVAAVLKERHYYSIQELIQESEFEDTSLYVMLDGVTDPHNLGAIMRAAECFGAKAIIWSKNRAAGITPIVTKSAAGATELLALTPVGNLADAIRKFKEAGFWIATSALTDKSQDLRSFDVPKKLVFVLGSEGKGVSPLVLKLSDFVIKAPMYGSIDSLNVSQAAAVFLYELREKFTAKGW